MKRFVLSLLFMVFVFPFLKVTENDTQKNGIIMIGKHNQPKHSRYEIGSIGGIRNVHDKIYDKGTAPSLEYKRRSTEIVTGLWTYDTYKYDRFIPNGKTAHARYHGYSVGSVVEACYKVYDAKLFKVSPILGRSCKYFALYKNVRLLKNMQSKIVAIVKKITLKCYTYD